MPETLNRQFPYPLPSSDPDVPYWLQQLAEKLDADMTAEPLKYSRLEVDRSDSINAANSTWGPGTVAQLTAAVSAAPASRNPAKFTFPATGQARLLDAGYYSASWAIVEPKDANNIDQNFSGYLTISTGVGDNILADGRATVGRSMTAHFTPRYFAAGSTLFFAFQSTTALKFRHRITITQHP